MMLRRYLGLSASIALAGAIVGPLAAASPTAALGALIVCAAIA